VLAVFVSTQGWVDWDERASGVWGGWVEPALTCAYLRNGLSRQVAPVVTRLDIGLCMVLGKRWSRSQTACSIPQHSMAVVLCSTLQGVAQSELAR
jgi:hypothetical protein